MIHLFLFLFLFKIFVNIYFIYVQVGCILKSKNFFINKVEIVKNFIYYFKYSLFKYCPYYNFFQILILCLVLNNLYYNQKYTSLIMYQSNIYQELFAYFFLLS